MTLRFALCFVLITRPPDLATRQPSVRGSPIGGEALLHHLAALRIEPAALKSLLVDVAA